MVQIGIDYYQTVTGGTSLEAAVSNWHCGSSEPQTVEAGAY